MINYQIPMLLLTFTLSVGVSQGRCNDPIRTSLISRVINIYTHTHPQLNHYIALQPVYTTTLDTRYSHVQCDVRVVLKLLLQLR